MILHYFVDHYSDKANEYLRSYEDMQKIVFIVYIIMTFFMFFLYVQFLIWYLNKDILKAKKLLALYPLHQASQNAEAFREAISDLS